MGRGIWGWMLALAVLLWPAGAAAQGMGPSDPRCVALNGGQAGVPLVGHDLPSVAGGGIGPVARGVALPEDVVFRSLTQTFTSGQAFVLRDGRVYVRPARDGRVVAGRPWRVLTLPACLDGRVAALSADRYLLLATTADGQIYSHDTIDTDASPERWTVRWGPFFWTGLGMRLWGDVRTWSTSEIDSDQFVRDRAGRDHHAVGAATLYALRGDGRRITYLDPWLPNDESREVCGPRRGTVPLATISASGSTVLAVSRRGELFTRMYDFDISGANTVFTSYTWDPAAGNGDARWQLPAPGWVRHARPPGRFTDKVTLLTTGLQAADRLLRVAGRDRRGRPGWWEKPLAARAWAFVAARGVLGGRWLPLAGRAAEVAPDDRRYAGSIGGAPAELLDFNAQCSPAVLRVHVADDAVLDLEVHSHDGLRQEPRAAGLDDVPREYNGALMVPAGVSDPRARAWLNANLGATRVATAPLAVTATRVRFLAQCWELTRDGGAARPDAVAVPPDPGMTVGRATELLKDGRTPSAC